MKRTPVCAVILIALLASTPARGEDAATWLEQGQESLARSLAHQPIEGPARNVILFIGDGMGISTVTAARILEGQRRGGSGEENLLRFEEFPYTALIKTYNTNQQTPDSAGTMSAIMTGAKTRAGMIAVGPELERGATRPPQPDRLTTLLELAEDAGLSTGVVTTTRITHATPAACYAHATDRNWEVDRALPESARAAGVADIARQLVEFSHGDGIEVALGGGRENFLPSSREDPESGRPGKRRDGRDLAAEWSARARSAYVWNKAQLDALDLSTVDHLLGLFGPSHLEFADEHPGDDAGEPSLTEMTAVAIDLLRRNPKGFFLVVEGGRIDHAHHRNNAYRALSETIELAEAVEIATRKTDPRKTLLVVTADHSHVFTLGGYATRGNPILGMVRRNDARGNPLPDAAEANDGKPYLSLSYADGPSAHKRGKRRDLTEEQTTAPSFQQEALVPLPAESHGGEDVALYARGPGAQLFHGVLEQNVIFHILKQALALDRRAQ